MESVSQLETTDASRNPSFSMDRKLLEKDARWQLVERIVASKGFAKSPFLGGFLLYVCEKHLLHLDEEISEQQVGISVFGRARGYNVSNDNIVRNYARILRQRLDAYFKTEGSGESIQIVIPRGKYVPLFLDSTGNIAEPQTTRPAWTGKAPADISLRRAVKKMPPERWIWLLALTCGLLAAALIVSLLHRPSSSSPIADRFWGKFFNASQDTFLVPGDSGLAIYENLTKSQVDLGSYVRNDYRQRTSSPLRIDTGLINDLGARRYTSVVDLDLVSAISRLPEVVPSRLNIRYARELQMDDLKQSNAILLGSVSANPWVDLFQKEMNFQFSYDKNLDTTVIHNLHPLPGEQEMYRTQESAPARTTYGVIAVEPNLENSGNVLLIEGINMAGTEGAADFLLSNMSSSLRNRVSAKKGLISPFEVLIETSNIGASAPQPKIISLRIKK